MLVGAARRRRNVCALHCSGHYVSRHLRHSSGPAGARGRRGEGRHGEPQGGLAAAPGRRVLGVDGWLSGHHRAAHLAPPPAPLAAVRDPLGRLARLGAHAADDGRPDVGRPLHRRQHRRIAGALGEREPYCSRSLVRTGVGGRGRVAGGKAGSGPSLTAAAEWQTAGVGGWSVAVAPPRLPPSGRPARAPAGPDRRPPFPRPPSWFTCAFCFLGVTQV